MKLFKRKIQSTQTEGAQQDVNIESLMLPNPTGKDAKFTNCQKTYSSQVQATLRKLKGLDDFGNSQVSTIVNTRVSILAGEGISIATEDEKFKVFIDKLIKQNRLTGSLVSRVAHDCEVYGKAVILIKGFSIEGYPLIKKLNMQEGYIPTGEIKEYPYTIKNIQYKEGVETVKLDLKYFEYIQTGGHGELTGEPTTVVGRLLTDCENYDRALKDLRRNNHIVSRITPHFKTKNSSETKALAALIQKIKWKIGKAFVGSAEFSYKSPSTSAHDNILKELSVLAKTLSTSGVPVHWLGWADLMSNRATAQNLYQSLIVATKKERTAIEEAFFDIIVKAQEVYINNGGSDIDKVNTDFVVTLPFMDYTQFKETIEAYSNLYADGVISMGTYRAIVPGIDPIKEAAQIEAENELNKSEVDLTALNNTFDIEEEEEILNDE